MIKNVIKRDGSIEPFQSEKLNLWAEWAAGAGVDWSSVTIGAYKKCHDNCTTADIQQALISECIDRATTGHLKMAGRLYISDMYKNIFGGIDKIPTLKVMYHAMTLKGLWANMSYSNEELDYLETLIDHSIDFNYIYSQLKQLVGKYGISDRTTGEYFETPQFTYMRFCMGSMNNTKREDRLDHIKNLYYLISNNKINAPTPYVLNFGTGHLGLASCALYTAHDDLLSLSAGDHIAYMMTAASSGLGSHIMTRSIKDPVRGGTIAHQGRLPYYKSLESATGANRQNGRGGACNTFYSVLDPEVLDIIGLRNPLSIDEKRIPDLDYTVSYNRFFAEKAAANEDWMLISYLHASDLWQAMYSPDQDLFSDLYYKYFNDDTVPKKILKARDIAFKFLKEAPQTGRAYTFDASEANTHTPFLDKIYSSNLCNEIFVPTAPFEGGVQELYSENSNGEIGLCNLMAIVLGRVKDDAEYAMAAYYCLLVIDEAIHSMVYPFKSLEISAKGRMSAGVGLMNLAYDMANKGFYYSAQSGKEYMHYVAERHAYFLYEASLRLGIERGNAPWMHKTKIPDGWLPIDTYNKNVDKIVKSSLTRPWESLRARIIENKGTRFSVVCAYMPGESSSIASNTTNSVYPVRKGVVIKTNGNDKNVFIAPNWEELGSQYELAWDIPNTDLIDMYAIFQKFTDQGISADLYIICEVKDGKRKISLKKLFTEWIHTVRVGLKSRYYMNIAGAVISSDQEDVPISFDDDEKGCAGGACTL